MWILGDFVTTGGGICTNNKLGRFKLFFSRKLQVNWCMGWFKYSITGYLQDEFKKTSRLQGAVRWSGSDIHQSGEPLIPLPKAKTVRSHWTMKFWPKERKISVCRCNWKKYCSILYPLIANNFCCPHRLQQACMETVSGDESQRNASWTHYPSSHNRGSEKWFPPIVVTLQIPPFSTSMIMGERVTNQKQLWKTSDSSVHSSWKSC